MGILSYVDMLIERMEHAPTTARPPDARSGSKSPSRHDTIEPELIAAVTNMGRDAKIHPTKATSGESLPEGFARSYVGFLICNTVMEVSVDQDVVKRETEQLRKHVAVAYFVGGRPLAVALE